MTGLKSHPKRALIATSVMVFAFIFQQVATADASSAPQKLTANFKMQRTISVLSDTVSSSGNLTLGGPGLLRWETLSPAKSVLVVNKGRAWIHYPDLGITKGFELGNDPVMSVLSEHLIALTGGDLDGMRKLYELTDQGQGRKRLVPKEAEVKKIFKEIRVEMSASGVASRVELVSAGGDVTTITFHNVRLNPALPADTFEEPQ